MELSVFAKSALAAAMTRAMNVSASRNAAGMVLSRLAETAIEQLVTASMGVLL
jgi:hypothetical protein